MILIGHRGAAGILPENTIASIEAAVEVGVDIIEIDLRVTKDNQLVLVHDPSLLRTTGLNRNVSDMTLKEVELTTTKSGYPIPTLADAIEAAGKIPLLLDCKGKGWAEAVDRELKKHKCPTPMVTAIDTREMFMLSELRPEIQTYVSELTRPFEAIYKARLLGFTGISLNFWVLSPFAYWYARRSKLKFMIFTINSVFLARFMHFLYPSAAIITNNPDKFLHLRKSCKNPDHNQL